MARFSLFKCKECGWSIYATASGKDYVMRGVIHFFMCKDCKEAFYDGFDYGTRGYVKDVRCPECGGANIVRWKPKDNCPKCGGEMEKRLEEGGLCVD
jgi:ribosomal protein S27E